MSNLKTANGKNVVIADASKSMLDEFICPANLSVAHLGDFLTFRWEPGESMQKKTRIRDVLFEQTLQINCVNAGSSYSVFLPYNIWESFEVLINDVLIYECASTDVDQSKMHLQRLYRRCKTLEEYKNTLINDMHTITSSTFSSTVTLANNNVFQSVNLAEFLHGILAGLWTHRVRKFELRVKLMSFSTAAALLLRLPWVSAGLDVGNELTFPIFNNTRLRFRLERFDENKPDPIPTSLPMIIYHPRYEQKNYGKAFASVTSKTINIKTEFSPIKMINYLLFYLKNDSANVPSILHEGLSYFSTIKVTHNGVEKENYQCLNDFYRYLNKNMENEYGHSLYLQGQTDDTFFAPRALVPFIHWKSIHDKINSTQVENVIVIAGKNNEYNNDEVTITVTGTLANHDLYVIAESFDISQVFANGKVERLKI